MFSIFFLRYLFLLIFTYHLSAWNFRALSSFIFFDIMQSISDEHYSIKSNITARIRWTQLKYYSVISVKRNYNDSSLIISTNNFADIWIFVNITAQTHLNSKKLLFEVSLAPYISQRILNIDFIDKNAWILANLQQSGKY